MKRNKIYLAVFAALSLSATACNDAVEHNIQAVDAPAFVGVSPQENIKAGLDSIIVTYDKNIFFASSQYERITLNGQPVVSANVIGSSNKLLLMANIVRGERYELLIPEGVVSGPNNMPAPEVKATLKAQSQQITTALANTNATAETKALYQKLVANYGQKTFSGAMADVAWNTNISNQVHALTGKYPAINGYDYIHLQSTSPGGWIDYANIAPVKTWHDAGGMVTIGWHWNVPTSNPYASTARCALWRPKQGHAVRLERLHTTHNASNERHFGQSLGWK